MVQQQRRQATPRKKKIRKEAPPFYSPRARRLAIRRSPSAASFCPIPIPTAASSASAGKMPVYRIRGVDVDFPFDAYDCQITYMDRVIESLQQVTGVPLPRSSNPAC